ncbi:MAG: hypothetical protein K8S98_02165 [Planctomycetes bacterium]|nr:hypothetical protein [Planctomycetota bacterium]
MNVLEVSRAVLGAFAYAAGGVACCGHVEAARATLQEPDIRGVGESVAAVGDCDGDGVDDFVVGAPLSAFPSNWAGYSGALLYYSGRTRTLIRTQEGRGLVGRDCVLTVGSGHGLELIYIEDDHVMSAPACGAVQPKPLACFDTRAHVAMVAVDAASPRAVIAIGEPYSAYTGSGAVGRVRIVPVCEPQNSVSLADSRVGSAFGYALCSTRHRGDASLIGVGAPSTNSGDRIGRFHVYTVGAGGENPRLLWTRDGAATADGFGTSVLAVDDLDGDEVDDFMVLAAGFVQSVTREVTAAAYCMTLSGKTGTELRRAKLSPTGMPAPLVLLDDLNGDGTREVARLNHGELFGRGSVDIVDARTLAVIRTAQAPDGLNFGSSACAMHLDADSHLDLIVGGVDPDWGVGDDGCAFTMLSSEWEIHLLPR